MKIVCMRSKKSSVTVDNTVVGKIDKGLTLLVGFTEFDNEEVIDYMVNKVINLRIFDDDDGVMNKSVMDVKGSILSISQFTLYADSKKGNRPSYKDALNGSEAIKLYELFNKKLKEHIDVETGVFGSDMLVDISNDGPVTIILERSGIDDKK